MANDTAQRWEGTVSGIVSGYNADQIWPLLEDFFNFHRYIPAIIDTCYGIEGTSGQPGCIRYCSKASSSGDGSVENWAHEKLLSIDPIGKCLSYKLMENNLGFNSHMATIKLLPFESQQQSGCEVTWSFALKPIEGSSFDNVFSIYDCAVKSFVKSVEDALQVQNKE
ncbi:hypothetical protein JCGZ_07301 [Jatropha curcas]|uniref:Bet v I/Major latex protein domain-containing protein n=1 Tax=Jatropha curcas TaxID=180498 RepID=A0A067KN99_JATCU|nr:lachrymatory-factor synthase [Jatropha curcas]KDP33730.1 hypothetical protein JCGZ_07301 [Jatropha curcas]